MGREYELKYAALPEQLEAIAASLDSLSVTRMETAYYDTPDGALSARRITLRRRMENGRAVCTVKTPASGGGRGEWEAECGDIRESLEILCKLGAPEDLLALPELVEVCGARFTRRACGVRFGQSVLEVALDRGILTGGGRETPLCEVEVELKSGFDADADSYAAALAQTYGLTPESKSKFRRALDLAKGE